MYSTLSDVVAGNNDFLMYIFQGGILYLNLLSCENNDTSSMTYILTETTFL